MALGTAHDLSASPAPTSRPRRAVWVGALAVAMATGAITAPLVGVLAPYLVADLGIAPGMLGVAPSLYYAAAAALSPLAGRLVERGAPFAALWWIAVSAPVGLLLLAAAPNFPTLVLVVSLGSVPLALANPATNAALAEWLERGRRGAATGWKQAGVPGALLVAGVVAPVVAERGGWRLAVIVTGVVVVAALALLLAVARPPPHVAVPPPDRGRVPQGSALRAGGLGWLLPYSVLMGAAVGTINTYLVQFGVDGYGLAPLSAGRLAIVAGLTGALSRPVLASAAERRGSSTGMLTGLGALSTAAVVLLAAGRASGPVAIGAAAALVGVSLHAWNGLAMLSVVTESPAGRVGGASGSVMRGFYGGLLLGPLVFGQVLDRVGYGPAWTLTAMATAVASGAGAWKIVAGRVDG